MSQVKVSLVMLIINSGKVLGQPEPLAMSDEEVRAIRESMLDQDDNPMANLSDEQLKQAIHQQQLDFRDKAPMSASDAATVILNGVKQEKWRILVGDDAATLHRMVRSNSEQAYEVSFFRAATRTERFQHTQRDGRFRTRPDGRLKAERLLVNMSTNPTSPGYEEFWDVGMLTMGYHRPSSRKWYTRTNLGEQSL